MRHYDYHDTGYNYRRRDDSPYAQPEPPPPTRPDREHVRRDHSTTYYTCEIRSGFTVDTLDQVKHVIRTYHGGAAGSALGHTAGAMSGLGGMLLVVADAGVDDDKFLKGLLKKVDDWHQFRRDVDVDAYDFGDVGPQRRRDNFSQSYDYDGPGPWHKATVQVQRHGDRLWVHLHRAYTSDCETPMAGKLGVMPDYLYSRHTVTWETRSDRFLVPADFFATLGSALGADGPSLGSAFAAHVVAEMTHPDLHHDGERFSVSGNGVRAVVELGALRHHPRYRLPKVAAQYPDLDLSYGLTSEGLVGPSVRHYQFSDWFYAVGVDVYFYPDGGGEEACVAAAAVMRAKYSSLTATYGD